MTGSAEGERLVPAGGGVVWRPAVDGGIEVVLIHRPRYDDWSLPKGKIDAGENAVTAAVREVCEETGLAALAGRRSIRTTYPVRQGTKRVDYWLMRPVGGAFGPNDEVDELRWLALPEAAELLSHDHDRAVLADAARTDIPREPTLLLLRHASAGERTDFEGPDELRPLDRRGREQARRLAEVLPAFGPVALLSADRVRCRQTLEPLAERLELDVGRAPELGEEEFQSDPEAGLALVERLLEPRPVPGVTVVCSQGGAIPSVLMALGVRWEGAAGALWPPSAKGSFWALGGRPGALAADYYRNADPDPLAP
ncbi:MAG: hydrolase [Frankiales bacterium]|nr:hydrolase [Frankiales bacterium]